VKRSLVFDLDIGGGLVAYELRYRMIESLSRLFLAGYLIPSQVPLYLDYLFLAEFSQTVKDFTNCNV
jgi:hypothetical protein